jgi:predicted phage terminase large subunit-like protein
MLEPNINETKLLNVHSTQNKQTRIFQGSGWIKDNCVFLNNSVVGSEYHNFFRQFTTYLMDGSSKNDDAPDSVHGLSSMARSFYKDSFND